MWSCEPTCCMMLVIDGSNCNKWQHYGLSASYMSHLLSIHVHVTQEVEDVILSIFDWWLSAKYNMTLMIQKMSVFKCLRVINSPPMMMWLLVGVRFSVDPPLRSWQKYLRKHWMDHHEIDKCPGTFSFYFGDPLSYNLAPKRMWVFIYSVSYLIKFGTNIHVPKGMKSNYWGDSWTFPLDLQLSRSSSLVEIRSL